MFSSPIAQRRWQLFKANRRGYISTWLFLIFFALTLCADFWANDRPIMIQYQNNYYWPVLKDYPETTFGGDFDTTADYRDPFMLEQIQKNGWAVWPLLRYSFDTINYNQEVPNPAPPSQENWLGTDDQGRDVVARMIYGFRVSVLFGMALTTLASIIGVAAGAVQGFFGGTIDLVFQRVIEIWQGMPVLYLLIIMSSIIAPSFFTLLFIMLLFSWMNLVGVVRAEVLKVRNLDYVRAARALGVSTPRILWRHVLPNALTTALTLLPFALTGAITTLTSLDFLGFGLPPGSASLGELLAQGKNNLQAPWLGLTAFFVLAVTLTMLTFIGEAVRDAFDPRKDLAA